jgi:predicted dehydrogenase
MSSVSRRHFFQGAVLAASATRVMGANDKINVGIIGLGGRGNDHQSNYMKIPEARIAGLCDVNQAARERAQSRLTSASLEKASEYDDMRKMFADKNIDAVSIATPNHWHALATIWACQAGKDVYCEKPASHNIHESRAMVATARKTARMVQIGSQSRSTPYKMRAMQMLHEGVIGKLYMAKGLCYKRRKSIGKAPVTPVPAGIDWSQFLGPAPMRDFTMNRYKYNWHWFWDTGNGDIGNQGVHEMDICRWGLGEVTWPEMTTSTGGKYAYDDDQETPNTQLASMQYPGMEIVFEVRGLLTGPEGGQPIGTYAVGNLFYGDEGWMSVDSTGFQIYRGEKSEKTHEEKAERGPDGTIAHMTNFLSACRSRNHKELHADIEIGAMSASLCHLANISYRVKHTIKWNAAGMNFGADTAANELLTRKYRAPYVVA